MVDLREKFNVLIETYLINKLSMKKGDWIKKKKSIIELNSSNKWGNSMHRYYNYGDYGNFICCNVLIASI